MRIAIDYTSAVRQGAGIGRYTRGLISALATLDGRNRYTLLVAGGGSHRPASMPSEPNFAYRQLPGTDRALAILWHRFLLPLYADVWAGGADLFHSPDFALPPLLRAVGLVTVHDLSYMHYPEHAQPGLMRYLGKAVPRSVRRARLVLADSGSTRDDIISFLGTKPDRIRVVYAGVGREFHPVTEPGVLARVRGQYGLEWPFVLNVGTLEPRKNHLRLLEAFSLLTEAHADLHLMLVGGKGWLYDDVHAAVDRLGLRDRVVFPGFVRDEDLPSLYTMAAAFAYPSLYEGFGLPVLEALACGTPTVCSDSSSLPEVAGDAALLVHPNDVDGLARALTRILSDETLRGQLRGRGLLQAARFTWEAAAASLMACYHEAATAV
jgi:glycosyltransferase involved in cell wall biosynthesis